jgi:hypothetical protein
MKVTEIAVTRKFNLGNYQTVDYHVVASLDSADDPKESLKNAEKIINDYWEGRTNALVAMTRKGA